MLIHPGKQRSNECFLNTLAMLSGNSVDKVLAYANVISPYQHSWDMFTATANDRKKLDLTYRALARKFVPWLNDIGSGIDSKTVATLPFLSEEDYIEQTSEGLGAILMAGVDPCCAHICAFEDGLIYDTGLDTAIDPFEHYITLQSVGMRPFKIINKPSF